MASYNVENFFDLHYDQTEYKEYIPHTPSWDQKAYTNKLSNITKVIQDLDPDILALQEIESQKALDAIVEQNPIYKYAVFYKNKNAAIGLALLSKYMIVSYSTIVVDRYDKYSRDILKVTVHIENKPLILYVNHWRSKRAAESQRIKYAIALKKEIDTLTNDDYIILGDLNSNYNEYHTFKYDKKLNDTYNITGINQILNTTIQENFIQKKSILNFDQKVHFNTWLELPKKKRFSSKFRNENNTPDNFLLSATLFDEKNISYINNSFQVFSPKYLYKNNHIIRWNRSKRVGYSDHLPIFATFSTEKQDYRSITNTIKVEPQNSINYLYEIQQISDYHLENVVVIYRTDKLAIIKQTKKSRAIMIYKPSPMLRIGSKYNLVVEKLEQFHGLKEIKKISNIVLKEKNIDHKEYYLNAKNIDLFDEKYINNIVYNIKGMYKKGHLYFGSKKIQLYFAKTIKKPEDGKIISISSGHLSIFKSTVQIVLHKEDDFRVF
ncbi:MAG: endonuclease/exonuclease/phosphatase family protein [Arcobacteraceae bacterium]